MTPTNTPTGTNPNRPTPTWVLWLVGLVGGVGIAVWIFLSTDNGGAAREAASEIGRLSVTVISLAAIFAGGWRALRRRRKP